MLKLTSKELAYNKGLELIEAVRHNDMATICLLLTLVDINFQDDRHGYTPLCTAVSCNNLSIIRYLLEKGADPNITVTTYDTFGKFHRGLTAIMLASQWGYNDALQLLLKYKADTNILSELRNTGLHIAYSLDTIKKLLEYGADPNIQNFENETSLHRASLFKQSEIIKLLVKNGANINIKNDDGNTSLHLITNQTWITPSKYSDMVDTLIQLGGDINAFNYNGEITLHLASCGNHTDDIDIMDCLIDQIYIKK